MNRDRTQKLLLYNDDGSGLLLLPGNLLTFFFLDPDADIDSADLLIPKSYD
jgi:hypothetical protein